MFNASDQDLRTPSEACYDLGFDYGYDGIDEADVWDRLADRDAFVRGQSAGVLARIDDEAVNREGTPR